MNDATPSLVKRLDYTPPSHLVERIALEFELDPQDTRVTAVSTVRCNPHAAPGPLRLDGDGLTLLSVAIDGRRLDATDYQLSDNALVLPRTPEAFELSIVTQIAPAANTALSGLYVSNGNFFTQCEAEGFRRITFFPDRPDVMARYQVTLIGDRERLPVLLSNGNLLRQGPWPAGADGRERHHARWEDPFPKPSYLFALVAGDLQASERRIRTGSGREALLQIWVEPGNLGKTDHAMRALERSIAWDEARFGLALDLDRFMIVATSDFNMGAMENKGLNIFNTRYVFAHPRIATDADFAAVEAVVGHEYFHNWTGNRVTCRDWFQLTLKEGLTVFRDQEFSADMLAADATSPQQAASARAVKRIEDVRQLRAAQFPEDAGPMAHPIRPDAYQEINNFYTMTVYEKGAEVVRMLQTLVGVEGFRRGIDRYFERHDGQAVTCDEFLAAIADANGRDLKQFAHWYSQSGTPRLRAEGQWDAQQGRYRLRLRQSHTGAPGPLHIPVALGLVGPDGKDMPLQLEGETQPIAGTRVLELTQHEQDFSFVGLTHCPVPSLLRHFSAPVILEQGLDAAQLAFLAAHDSDAFNRWEAGQRLATNTLLAMLTGQSAIEAAATLTEVWGRCLNDEHLDAAFRELMLVLPSEGVIADQLERFDPWEIHQARRELLRHLGCAHQTAWARTWQMLAPGEPFRPDARQAGRRALRNIALAYWTMSGDARAFEAAAQQCAQADNMSARQGALAALIQAGAPQAQEGLATMAAELGDEPLAMDRWFMLQATAPGAQDGAVLAKVQALLDHPAFSVRNPNKVRAMLGGFLMSNPAQFHAIDGSGYRFWESMIARLDALNPQVAARLARAMDRWRRLTEPRRTLARESLSRVAALPGLSRDVAEVVGKALAQP